MKRQTAYRIFVTMLMLVTAMLMPNIAWAQDDQLALTLVSSDANSFENQGPDKLVYGQSGTALKWCSKQEDENGEFVPFYIIVKTDKRTVLERYDLYEASEITGYENADWKDWTIYGTNDDPAAENAQWNELHKVTEAQLFDGTWGRKHTFTIDNNKSSYIYYKVQVTAVVGKTKYESSKLEYIQMMGHMKFYGETPNLCDNGDHLFGELTAAKDPTCTEAGKIAYRQCVECNKYFDLDGNELADEDVVIPACHTFGEDIPAKGFTCTEAGNIAYHQCAACNKYFDMDDNELAEGAWVLPATGHTFDSDEICTRCGSLKQYILSFSIEESSWGIGNEGPGNAINGVTTDKWCAYINGDIPYIVLKHDMMAKLDHYYLYTGNDILFGGANRNPKEWKLYAKRNDKDEWTLISHITDGQLPTTNSTQSNDYAIEEEKYKNEYYKYFKFEIIGIEKGNTFELGELCLMGRPCSHIYADGRANCSICGTIKEHEHTYEKGICSQCDFWVPSLLSFNIVRAVPAANVDETADKAFDGITTNKWCGEILSGHPYVLLQHDCKAKMKYYNLYTGNDIHHTDYQGLSQKRNPGEWKLYAKENADDQWTLISHVKEAKLPDAFSTLSKDYLVDEAYQDNYYKFFKFEIINHEIQYNGASDFFEIGELCFYGLSCSHEFDDNDVCTACGAEKTHQHSYEGGFCTKCEDYEPVSGMGTKANPYLIGNAGQLAWFRDQTQNGIHDICAKLTADIDMSSVCSETVGTWMAIADYSGTFDGDGHVLKNLYINDQYSYAALFYQNKGIIKNLGIESGSVTSSNYGVAAMCGYNYGYDGKVGQIINCFNNADVKSTYSKFSNPNVAGICAENKDGIIERCYNTGKISGRSHVAGICAVLHSGTVADCYNTGTISAESNNVGGIVGIASLSTVRNCYNVGKVMPSFEQTSHGIVGAKAPGYLTLTNCYYLEDTRIDERATALTAEQFASGEAAWLLNGSIDDEGNWVVGKTDGTQAWYQKLAADAYPVLLKTDGNTVFSDCTNSTKSYDNSDDVISIHAFGELVPSKNPTCEEAGYKAYHVCTRCNRYCDEDFNLFAEDEWVMRAHGHTFNDDLVCTSCGNPIGEGCIIEYTATEKLSYILGYMSYEYPFDYTENFSGEETWAEYCFGAPVFRHEYDETTQKGRIIFKSSVPYFYVFTDKNQDRLTSITLPSTVKEISDKGFYDCHNIKSITLRADYSEDLDYALYFNGCNNLREIFVPYSSYHQYVEACKDDTSAYWDKNEGAQYIDTKDMLKSLLSLDDTKDFQTPANVVKADVTLQRSFSNDGWYSLCLPFSVSVEDSPFSQVAEFNELDGDTCKFTTVDAIEAGKAYIVKVDADVANPTFQNVFITTEAPATDDAFIGVYSPTELSAGCKVIGSGTSVNPAKAGTMKGFRAYFPASSSTKARYFSVDDSEVSSIESIKCDDDNFNENENFRGKTYSLMGTEVGEGYRGVVIRNGKKVLRK